MLDSLNFVAAVEVIEAGNVIESIEFEEAAGAEEPKRKRGRPKLTEEQKAAVRAKREAGKTRRFAVGEEPNRRSTEN
ncbi:MAG: hypothetical protein J5809_05190 [Selenomonadaceae bacterium]|nr:hypothetical protein [Selenomonadaceae bacterium]